MTKWLTDNLLPIALAFGAGAMAVGAYSVKLEIADLRGEIKVTQRDVAHVKEFVDELRANARGSKEASYTGGPNVAGRLIRR